MGDNAGYVFSDETRLAGIRKLIAAAQVPEDVPTAPTMVFLLRLLDAERARREEAKAALLRAAEPISERYACMRCGRRDGLDAVVSDTHWRSIATVAGLKNAETGGGILCLWCMDEIALAERIAAPVGLHFAGRALYGDCGSEQATAMTMAARMAAGAVVAAMREQAQRIAESYGYPATSQLARALAEMVENGSDLARAHDAAVRAKVLEEAAAFVEWARRQSQPPFSDADLPAALRALAHPEPARGTREGE